MQNEGPPVRLPGPTGPQGPPALKEILDHQELEVWLSVSSITFGDNTDTFLVDDSNSTVNFLAGGYILSVNGLIILLLLLIP